MFITLECVFGGKAVARGDSSYGFRMEFNYK
jgi:hypothetical protein